MLMAKTVYALSENFFTSLSKKINLFKQSLIEELLVCDNLRQDLCPFFQSGTNLERSIKLMYMQIMKL